MFCPPPDEEKEQPQPKTTLKTRNSRKKRKKNFAPSKNFKKEIFKKKNRLVLTMSAWAEHFTVAATWQLKHQLAYWKARAKSLEYENQLLHDIIRKNCTGNVNTKSSVHCDQQNSVESQDFDSDSETEEEECSEQNEGELEVSEEFIQFLQMNAKYKEDARLERERLKAKNEGRDTIEELEAGPSGPRTNNSEELQNMYGANWKRIAALEMFVQSEFLNDSDKCKPTYWPNIPFNFG